MSVETSSNERWLNHKILGWARKRCERTLEEVAAKFKRSVEEIEAWESGARTPTVRQARELAKFYERPFLEFFLSSAPEIPEPQSIPDYRMHAGVTPPRETREVLDLQQWVETQRDNALDLLDEIGEDPPTIPDELFTTIEENPEYAAEGAREAIGYSPQEQLAIPKDKAAQLPTILRSRLEALGILTLKKTEMAKHGIRGICLAEFPLPVIAFSSEAPTAQAFTLSHELGHILVRDSGIIGSRQRTSPPVEKWCDHFAAAFLMPAEQMDALVGDAPTSPAKTFPDDDLNRIAEMFRVSPHAMLIRLVHLGYVEEAYYWDVKKPQFDEAAKNFKQFGRAKYYGVRYKNAHGDLYTGLVLQAWATGRITNHNAAEFMGIKNLAHLFAIRADLTP